MSQAQEARSRVKSLNVPLHPELHKELSIECIREETNQKSLLHHILCHRYGRPDLISEVPQ